MAFYVDKVNILINLSTKTAVFVDLFVSFGKEPSDDKDPFPITPYHYLQLHYFSMFQ